MASTFSMDLTRFANRANSDIKTVIRKISFEAFKRIVLRTPVDTGRARANWNVKVGSPATYQIEATDQSGSATLSVARDGTLAWDCTGSIFLTNNLPYIGTLEYGRADGRAGSQQAPQGMVRLTMEEMTAWIATNAVRESISSIRGATS